MIFLSITYGIFGGYVFWKILEGTSLFRDKYSGKIRGAGIILLPFLIWYFWGEWRVILAILAIALMGTYDDIRGLNGKLKLLLTSTISIFFILKPPPINLFGYNFFFEPFNLLFWFLFLVGFTNASNVIDGKDGILLSTYIVIFVFIFFISQEKFWMHLAGILVGLLFYNSPPAKLIMGDVGSYTIGFVSSWGLFSLHIPFEAILLVLFFPFADTTLAFSRRVLRGRSIFERDEEHIHHRVSKRLGDRISLALNFIMNIFGSSMAYLYLLTGNLSFIILGYTLWIVYIYVFMRL